MSRRALAEKRPLLLASIAAALAFYYLRWGTLPELYLIPVKGAAVGLLALYLWLRHSSPDARLLAWAFGAASLGDMVVEVETERMIGGLLFFAYHVLAMGVYLRNRRQELTSSQKGAVVAMLLLTPLLGWLLPSDRDEAMNVTLYALALGAMAASAWASVFPRYRVGAGAVLFLVADVLLFAEMGPLQGHIVPQILIWPVYYLGQLLIATGVVQTLRKRDPELKLVSSN
jgi:phosphoglycerol transferase MdoB-like AlkP superfamily enzyme